VLCRTDARYMCVCVCVCVYVCVCIYVCVWTNRMDDRLGTNVYIDIVCIDIVLDRRYLLLLTTTYYYLELGTSYQLEILIVFIK
jgi:hypothetical protein